MLATCQMLSLAHFVTWLNSLLMIWKWSMNLGIVGPWNLVSLKMGNRMPVYEMLSRSIQKIGSLSRGSIKG